MFKVFPPFSLLGTGFVSFLPVCFNTNYSVQIFHFTILIVCYLMEQTSKVKRKMFQMEAWWASSLTSLSSNVLYQGSTAPLWIWFSLVLWASLTSFSYKITCLSLVLPGASSRHCSEVILLISGLFKKITVLKFIKRPRSDPTASVSTEKLNFKWTLQFIDIA